MKRFVMIAALVSHVPLHWRTKWAIAFGPVGAGVTVGEGQIMTVNGIAPWLRSVSRPSGLL
jgi:hypothetical protein